MTNETKNQGTSLLTPALPLGTERAYLHWMLRPTTPPLELGPFATIGRESSCSISIDDQSLSARHARFEKRGDTWSIRDLQSTAGVYVNDQKVGDSTIKEQDSIRLGDLTFVFSLEKVRQGSPMSKNEAWNRELSRLPSFAQTDFPVLMIGPSGSGKEVLARAIHEASRRKKGALVTINCSALSESLIESELFGHVRGSFTGATHDRQGAFESARGGTLFLDEIGDLPLNLQPKLLRAIENREIRPVGSDRTIETDVRIVAATHKDLVKLVQQGRFRADLFWRLNVCVLRPPALGDRMEDFTDLVYEFCKQLRVSFSYDAIERLRSHTWAGNVRELRNMIARAKAYFGGSRIEKNDIEWLLNQTPKFEIPATNPPELNFVDSASTWTPPTSPSGNSSSVMREIEREMIVRRLLANKGNQRKTATELGMPKSTLHDRLKVYEIDLEEIKRSAHPNPLETSAQSRQG